MNDSRAWNSVPFRAVLDDGAEQRRAFPAAWQHLLRGDKWGVFLANWTRALGVCGTGSEFLEGVRCEETCCTIAGETYRAIRLHARNYAQRGRLMREQVPYLPAARTYRWRLDLRGCPLCQNIAQACDAALQPRKFSRNFVLDLGTHLILPNRYPPVPGACLLVPKRHQDRRAATASDLQALQTACRLFDFAAVRNHPRDGMSVPRHDHWHLMPADLPLFAVLKSFVPRRERGALQAVEPAGTPFASLLLSGGCGRRFMDAVLRLLQRLDCAREVYTLAYYAGAMLVTARRSDRIGERGVQVGAGIGVHALVREDRQFWRDVEQYVPLKGEFRFPGYEKACCGSR